MANTAEAQHDDHDHHMPGFFTRWFCSTNHKDIGTLYILLSFIAAIIGGAMSWYIRLELAAPGIQYIDDFQFYNVLVTAHGFLMVFFVVMINRAEHMMVNPIEDRFTIPILWRLVPLLKFTAC